MDSRVVVVFFFSGIMDRLPEDAVCHIVGWITGMDCIHLSRTCLAMRDMFNSTKGWTNLRFGQLFYYRREVVVQRMIGYVWTFGYIRSVRLMPFTGYRVTFRDGVCIGCHHVAGLYEQIVSTKPSKNLILSKERDHGENGVPSEIVDVLLYDKSPVFLRPPKVGDRVY